MNWARTVWNGFYRRPVLLIAFLLALLALVCTSGCAIAVRPVAKLVPQSDGTMRFYPDPEQEPHVPAAVVGILGSILSPDGLAAGTGIGGLIFALIAGIKGAANKARAEAEAKRAEEHKADADDGWRKFAEERAAAAAATPPKGK